MSVSEFSPPPSPKSPATTVSSLSDASSDAHSRLFSDDWRDVGTVAGHTDLNTTVVSDSKLPLPTWEAEPILEYPIEEEEAEHHSPSRSKHRRSPGATSSKRTHSRQSSRKSTPKPAVDVEFVAFDDIYAPIEDIHPQPRPRPSSARKRTRSAAGLGKEPAPTYQARTRKVSTRSYRRSSGEPRMNQVPVSRDFFLICGLCVVLASAMIVATRPAISAVYA